MARAVQSSLQREIPAYKISINVSDFEYRKSSFKEKLQKEYIPHYWEKCRMNQKTVLESSEDRLSQLTTGQIDRIIDMEKIKILLYDRKRKVKEHYFQYDQHDPNMHANVYQANFLAKINQIAIKRNIRHEDLEGFDELIKQKLEKIKMKHEQKKQLVMPYKYAKRYRSDASRRVKTQQQEDDAKSIESIQDDLEEFQEKISLTKRSLNRSLTKKEKSKVQFNKLLPPKRWFYGMSTYYLDKNQPQRPPEKQQTLKSTCYDIQSQIKVINQLRSSSFCNNKTHGNTTQSTTASRQREHLKRKANHLTIIKMT